MDLPRTDYHEALGAFHVPDAAVQEATIWSFTADEQKNAEILRRVEEHMVIPKFSFATRKPYALPSQTNKYDAVAISSYMSMSEPASSDSYYADDVAEAAPVAVQAEDIDDHLVWADLGHIHGLNPADPDTDYLAWSGLGHIKDHGAEVARQREDDKLLRQTDFIIAAKGLTKLLMTDQKGFASRTDEPVAASRARADKEAAKAAVQADDFDDWTEVLAANEKTKKDNRDFWAEVEIADKRLERIKETAKKIGAVAAAAVLMVPFARNFLINRAVSPNSDQAAVVSVKKGHHASLAGGQITIPKAVIPSTSSTVVTLENNVVTVTPAPEAPQISAAELAAKAQEKAAAGVAAATEAQVKTAAEAEAAKVAEKQTPSLAEYLAGICGSDDIRSGFGMRLHPIYGTWKMHTGIDVGCARGAEIHAVKSGTVTYAGWMDGYGNVIIVDHGADENGDDISTLYAHADSLDVHVGEEVTDDVLGEVGCTGDCTGPHMHTEIRVNGVPVDPASKLDDFKR